MRSHIRAIQVEALVDWPPGSAKKWRGWPDNLPAQPDGAIAPANVLVTLELGELAMAGKKALGILKEMGHRWAFIRHIVRLPGLEAQAVDLVRDALQEVHDSRAQGPEGEYDGD